jgi:putative ATP-binding cassette transporter
LLSLTNATDAAEHSPAVCDPLNAYGRISSRTFDPHNGAYRDRTVLSIEHLDLCTPDQKRLLIKDLNLQLREGENLLIVGNSGAGKSSLLRGIAGLWTVGNGVVSRPVDEEVYFLPQRPYCTIGSLRDQLLYPAINAQEYDGAEANGQKIVPRSHILKDQWTDEELLLVLEKVDLVEVAERAGDGDATKGLEAVLDWSNMLSLGEQQRLAFGRLLVNRPRLVILDEATSALDMVSEARMYNVLKNMARKELTGSAKLSAPGLTYVSVGHRPSLLAYHDKRLRLMGEEDHEVTTVEKEQVQLQNQIQNL